MAKSADASSKALASWTACLLAAHEQALQDLAACGGAELVFVRAERGDSTERFVDELESAAHAADWATARVSVHRDRAFDTLDGLVRALARKIQRPAAKRDEGGILSLADAFVDRHRGRAVSHFDAAIDAQQLVGDLVTLVRAYLAADDRVQQAARRVDAWLSGTELARIDDEPNVFHALSARTAKRALRELTGVARAFGHKGTLLLFEGADVIAKLTPHRRQDAYTVLREFVDNADGGRGLASTRIVIIGGKAMFDGPNSISLVPALVSRVKTPVDATDAPPPPHRPSIDVAPPASFEPRSAPRVRRPEADCAQALRSMIRGSHGLPAVEPVTSMTVGAERIDAAIETLFEHSAMQGSVFTLLTGPYGSGKTHLLLHLADRALRDHRPVFRLSLERLDADLGAPQRHLQRLLENATLPTQGRPDPLTRLAHWMRTPTHAKHLTTTLEAIRDTECDARNAAARAVRIVRAAKVPMAALENYLAARDLVSRPSSAAYRHDAYQRFLLWLELLDRLEKCAGPVVLIDEAENLYRGGATRSERRTALRSLSFYCGGTLPRACVIFAVTPEALRDLRAEAKELLAEVAEQKTLLAWEDAEMFRRRLSKTRPMEVPALKATHRGQLAQRARGTHAKARGATRDPDWSDFVEQLEKSDIAPRDVVRRGIDRLEERWWLGSPV